MDIQTVWDNANQRGDWAMAGPDLATGNDLITAVLVSLFTDQVAAADDVIPDGGDDPRGWWGDALDDRPIGSKLWLYYRNKADDRTPGQVKDAIRAALQWMIDDGAVARITVETQYISVSAIGARIVLFRQSKPALVVNFPNLWAAFGAPAPGPAGTLQGGMFDFSYFEDSGELGLT